MISWDRLKTYIEKGFSVYQGATQIMKSSIVKVLGINWDKKK